MDKSNFVASTQIEVAKLLQSFREAKNWLKIDVFVFLFVSPKIEVALQLPSTLGKEKTI